MAWFYVYVLGSESDGKRYVGVTDNLKRRFVEHQEGKVKSTKHRRPVMLLCCEAYPSKEIALGREKYLKSSDGRKDLDRRFVEGCRSGRTDTFGERA